MNDAASDRPTRRREKWSRVGAQSWIDAGFRALARHGVAGLHIEKLARDLKVSKGSFYWHYADRSALLDAMLDSWRHQAGRIHQDLGTFFPGKPREQLLALLRMPRTSTSSREASQIELAIRLWARRDAHVSEMLVAMHEIRLEAMIAILAECGVPAGKTRGLALLMMSIIVDQWISDSRSTADFDRLVKTAVAIVDAHVPAKRSRRLSGRPT